MSVSTKEWGVIAIILIFFFFLVVVVEGTQLDFWDNESVVCKGRKI